MIFEISTTDQFLIAMGLLISFIVFGIWWFVKNSF